MVCSESLVRWHPSWVSRILTTPSPAPTPLHMDCPRSDYPAHGACPQSGRELRCGTVNINEVRGPDRMLSFGGIKDSGLGIKEGVIEAMKCLSTVKTFSFHRVDGALGVSNPFAGNPIGHPAHSSVAPSPGLKQVSIRRLNETASSRLLSKYQLRGMEILCLWFFGWALHSGRQMDLPAHVRRLTLGSVSGLTLSPKIWFGSGTRMTIWSRKWMVTNCSVTPFRPTRQTKCTRAAQDNSGSPSRTVCIYSTAADGQPIRCPPFRRPTDKPYSASKSG